MFLLFAQFLSWCCLLTRSSVRNLFPLSGSHSKNCTHGLSTVQCIWASIPVLWHPGSALPGLTLLIFAAARCPGCGLRQWMRSLCSASSCFSLSQGYCIAAGGTAYASIPSFFHRQNPFKSVQTSNVWSESGSDCEWQNCESSSSCWRGQSRSWGPQPISRGVEMWPPLYLVIKSCSFRGSDWCPFYHITSSHISFCSPSPFKQSTAYCPLQSQASPPTHLKALLGFSLCSSVCAHLGKRDIFALTKQGGGFNFLYDKLVGINKIGKSKMITGTKGNKLF